MIPLVLIFFLLAETAVRSQVVTSDVVTPGAGGAIARRTAPASPPVPVKPEDLCAIEGTVRNAATGEAVKSAELSLRRTDVRPDSGFPTAYSTSTDGSGKFAMRNIEPGSYQLAVTRTGFAPMQYGARRSQRTGTTLRLAPQQRLSGVDLRLTPHAVIAGRVADQEGEPLANVQVMAMSYRYAEGRRQLMPVGSGSTNDLGEYRIFGLFPGRYYLQAVHRPFLMSMAADRSVSPQEEDYVPTFYPGVADVRSAAQLDAGAGMVLQQTNIRLTRSRTVRVRGQVIDRTGPGGRLGPVMLAPKEGGFPFGMNRSFVTGAEGQFELRGVAPGSYTLVAHVNREGRSFNGRETIEVGSRDLENVVITIHPGADLRGEVQAEEPGTVDLSKLRVSLRPWETYAPYFGPMPTATVTDNGAVVLSQTGPDRYAVSVSGLPDGFYLKSVRLAEEEVLESGLDLSRGAAGLLQITVSGKAGQVEGAVTNDQQAPAAGATIVLIPRAPQRRERFQFHQTVTTDQNGRFVLKNVTPGEYQVYAWEDVEIGSWMDPAVLQPVEGKGQSVAVRESGRETVDLRVIPAP